MTQKEFKTHDWRIGETLYRIRYNTYKHFEIPWKIEKVKVSIPSDGWINLETKHAPFAFSSKCTDLKDYFFDYKSAKQAFERCKEEFKNVRAMVVLGLRMELYDVYRRCIYDSNKIFGLLRMNIMQ